MGEKPASQQANPFHNISNDRERRLRVDSRMRMLLRSLLSLPVVSLAIGTLLAANDPFVGKWKVNPSKSKLTDEVKVETVGENKYAITFGPGAVDTIVADGTDQPALQGTTLSVTVEGANNWKVVRKKEGRRIVSAIWTLSADGKTLDDAFTGYQPDGSPVNVHYTYQRAAGSSGFPGTWDSVKTELDSSIELEIQPYEGDGLSIRNPGQQIIKNIKFDGKDYAVIGPDVPPGSASSGRRVNERSLQITNKFQGKITDTREIEVSIDLKTLTMRIREAGEKEPKNILVFDRE
jgi:hypothetical protein